jgi:hypothetical protein
MTYRQLLAACLSALAVAALCARLAGCALLCPEGEAWIGPVTEAATEGAR